MLQWRLISGACLLLGGASVAVPASDWTERHRSRIAASLLLPGGMSTSTSTADSEVRAAFRAMLSAERAGYKLAVALVSTLVSYLVGTAELSDVSELDMSTLLTTAADAKQAKQRLATASAAELAATVDREAAAEELQQLSCSSCSWRSSSGRKRRRVVCMHAYTQQCPTMPISKPLRYNRAGGGTKVT